MGNWKVSPVSEYPLESISSLRAAQAFLQKLVRNLFAEGNDLFREKDFKLSLVQYVEGLNVADYAASDEVTISKELLCKLHVNRAACYFAMVSAFPSRPQELGGHHGCCAMQLEKISRGVSAGFVHSLFKLGEATTHRKVWYLLTIALCLVRPEEGCEEGGPGLRY